jgi:hypothetical protein
LAVHLPELVRSRPPWQIVLGVVGAFGVTVQSIFGVVSGSLGLFVGVAFALLALWALGILGALGHLVGKAVERWGYVPRQRFTALREELADERKARAKAQRRAEALEKDYAVRLRLATLLENVPDLRERIAGITWGIVRGNYMAWAEACGFVAGWAEEGATVLRDNGYAAEAERFSLSLRGAVPDDEEGREELRAALRRELDLRADLLRSWARLGVENYPGPRR